MKFVLIILGLVVRLASDHVSLVCRPTNNVMNKGYFTIRYLKNLGHKIRGTRDS